MMSFKKSRNGDSLGPVELIVWTEQSDQGDQSDRREQDDQDEVSIIIFGMSKSSGFRCLTDTRWSQIYNQGRGGTYLKNS